MTNDRTLISLENVSFSFGPTLVLDRITLSIDSGDFLAVLGPNGSGKTTLVKLILGLLTPDNGRILIMDIPSGDFRAWHKIGYVPQKATNIDPFFPASVMEVVAMALYSHRKIIGKTKKEAHDMIEWALDQVAMTDFRDRPIGGLSGGQQQRVFIARALVTEPRILILDEPTTGVDAQTQERFYDMLNDLNGHQGLTIVLITHDIGIVNRHITRVACLNQHLVYHGSHDEFCGSPAFREMLDGGHHLISHRH